MKLEEEVLRLEPRERAKLARRLLESFEALSAEEIEVAWLDEVERRERAIEAGESAEIPGDQVFAEARRSLS
jgi:putative addiction module component (TIGR02574 family)